MENLSFFLTTLTTPYYLGSMLNTATLFVIASLGAIFCTKSGELNLGGEGQIYLGGFITAILLNAFSTLPAFFAILFSFLASMFFSGFLTLLSAILKKSKNTSFLLTSFIISAAIIPIIDGFIANRFNEGTLLATPFINERFRFPIIFPPSSLNISFFIAIVLMILIYLFFSKTKFGSQIEVYGISPEFAIYSGLNITKISFVSAFMSGAFHGLTGAIAICGTYYTCHTSFAVGLGWNALSVAMIASNNPILTFPAAIFLAWILTSAERISMFNNANYDISSLIQAIILFIISIPFVANALKKKNKKSDVKAKII